MKLINADALVHIPIYDEQTEETIIKGMSIADFLDTFTDEGCPPAQPERKSGKWIGQKGGGYCCSECGRYALDEVDGNFIHVAFESNFCPYCGAEMVEK